MSSLDEDANTRCCSGSFHPSCVNPNQLRSTDKPPTNKLLRDPINLDELSKYDRTMAIWRNNGTLTYVSPSSNLDTSDVSFTRRLLPMGLSLKFCEKNLTLYISGSTDDAIKETMDYFLSLEEPESSSRLEIRGTHGKVDARAIMDRLFAVSYPSREVQFRNLALSVEMSFFLASRPHPTRIAFVDCVFEDEGTAFINALERRQTSFGSLTFYDGAGISDDNMIRLFLQVNVLDHLGFSYFEEDNELTGLALSAQVESLDCCLDFSEAPNFDLHSLNIVANKLSLTLEYDDVGVFPTEFVLPLFRRLAELGHFVELKIEFDLCFGRSSRIIVPQLVAEELIRTVLANTNLTVLELSTNGIYLDWGPQLVTLFQGLQVHKALRRLKLSASKRAFGPNFSHLREFLSHHRNITVIDSDGCICSDGTLVDALYSLNRFYRDSSTLWTEPLSNRSLLIATTLLESASTDFQRSALLLANHADALCELVQCAQFDSGTDRDDDPRLPAHQDHVSVVQLVDAADRDVSSQSDPNTATKKDVASSRRVQRKRCRDH